MQTAPTIEFILEFELDEKTKAEIAELLAICFPNTDYQGKSYFKQLPHYRLIVRVDNKVVGQMGIDYRIMSVNKIPVAVFGVIDLVVHPSFRGKGLGTKLMLEFEKIATAHKNNIDFLFLVTDVPLFYERLGYKRTFQTISWLKLYQGKNYGIGNEQITDSFLMVKALGNKVWEGGELDMLGYMY